MTDQLSDADRERMLVDPVGAITDVVTMLEPALGEAVVRAAIEQAATNRPARRQLAHVLASEPKLLISGSPEGPVSVDRLITALVEVGGSFVVLPRCADCGKQNPLPVPRGRVRICTGCDAKRRAAKAACSSCGRHMVGRYRNRNGGALCAGCRPKDDHLVLDQVCSVICSSITDLGSPAVRDAVAATLRRPHYQRRLMWELEDHPDLLTGGGARGSARTVAVIEALAAAGSRQVVVPPCPLCDRLLPLRHGLDGQRVCHRCYDRRHYQRCCRCERDAKVSGRTPEGDALCRSCYQNEPINQETCAVCGRRRKVSSHNENGDPVCDTCTTAPLAECVVCGVVKPCFGVAAGTPRCEACTRPIEPCVTCGKSLRVHARTPAGGPVCSTCHRKDPRWFATCASCGMTERLHHRGLCKRCAADRALTELLTGPDGHIPGELLPLHTALMAGEPGQLLEWLGRRGRRSDNPTTAALLRALATGECAISHDALDARSSKQIEHLRSVLVYAGVLTARDEHVAAMQRWIAAKLGTISSKDDLLVLRAFITWHCLPRLRHNLDSRPASASQINSLRNRISIATEFLAWLRGRGQALYDADQADIDEWLTTGPSTRYHLRAFLLWAVQRGHAVDIVVPVRKSKRHTAPIDADQRWDMARNLLHSNDVALPYRVAGLLVLLYAQPMATLVEMTVDQVIRSEGIYLRLGPIPLHLPEPLDDLVVRLVEEHSGQALITRRERSTWLFPGAQPGKHISYIRMVTHLHQIGIHGRPTRAAALLDLCAQLPPIIVSRLLGLSVATAEAWSHTSGVGTYASVIAQRSDNSGMRVHGGHRPPRV